MVCDLALMTWQGAYEDCARDPDLWKGGREAESGREKLSHNSLATKVSACTQGALELAWPFTLELYWDKGARLWPLMVVWSLCPGHP
jgi:hypothetical protein